MLVAKNVSQCISGFALSLATVVLSAVTLYFTFFSIWVPPQSFLGAYGTAVAISIIAIVTSWVCLLMGLKNKAMIRGVWYQIYTFVGIAVVGLTVALFL